MALSDLQLVQLITNSKQRHAEKRELARSREQFEKKVKMIKKIAEKINEKSNK